MIGMPAERLAVHVAFQLMMSNLQQAGGKHDKQQLAHEQNVQLSFPDQIHSWGPEHSMPSRPPLDKSVHALLNTVQIVLDSVKVLQLIFWSYSAARDETTWALKQIGENILTTHRKTLMLTTTWYTPTMRTCALYMSKRRWVSSCAIEHSGCLTASHCVRLGCAALNEVLCSSDVTHWLHYLCSGQFGFSAVACFTITPFTMSIAWALTVV